MKARVPVYEPPRRYHAVPDGDVAVIVDELAGAPLGASRAGVATLAAMRTLEQAAHCEASLKALGELTGHAADLAAGAAALHEDLRTRWVAGDDLDGVNAATAAPRSADG